MEGSREEWVEGAVASGTSTGPAPVTAVIPAFNRERLIADSVRSVREQTLPVAEILVVDDGSTDRTAERARKAGARVIRQENQGVSVARNAGIRAAAQEWIALLDSDDLWEPGKIEAQMDALALEPAAGLVFTDWLHFDDSGVVETDVLQGREVYRGLTRRHLSEDVALCDRRSLATRLFRGNFIKPSSILARKRVLLESGLFDPGFGRADSLVGQVEDRDFFIRLVANTDVLAVERSLVRYRIHAGGASRNRIGMAMGAAAVADRVFAHPERYPEGAVEFFRRDQPERLREAGVLLMEDGRFGEARRVLWRSLRKRPAPRALASFALALAGRRVHRSLVTLKRRLNLPGLRSGAG